MDESRVRDPFAGPVEAPEERSPGHHAVMAVGVGVAGLLVGTVAGLVTGVVLGVGVATLDVLAAADLTAVVTGVRTRRRADGIVPRALAEWVADSGLAVEATDDGLAVTR